MSIFKSTLDPTIAAQLKAREKVVSTDSVRDSDFLRYTTGKNGWVRMSSFVNYDSKGYKNGNLIDDGRYNGDALARKYVLEGGTLYNKGNKQFSLRAGVGNLDGIYASDIDKIGITGNKVDRLYGLRPMPGITSVNVLNKSAYGSLREATVQFYAWDKHQLEELEVLYMRTGYTVFLEWGWSEYIDHGNITKINDYPVIKGVQNFNRLTLDAFQSNLTEEVIYDKIEQDIKATKGNYDAMLGYVKNFSWQLMPNGGFQCSTTLISRGETIETLKVSTNSNSVTFPTVPNTFSVTEVPAFAYSSFEKIFLNIIGHVNESEFAQIGVAGIGTLTGELFIAGSNTTDQQALRDQADEVWDLIVEKLKKGIFKEAVGSFNNYVFNNINTFDLTANQCVVKLADGKTEGTYIEYISMDAFIAIINEIFIPYNTQNTTSKVAYIVLPNITPCLASEDSVSIDPTTCLIKNSLASFITDQTDGFNPYVFSESNTAKLSPGENSDVGTLPEFLTSGTTNIGQIGNIYISIEKIIDIYRSKAGESDGVDILDLLQDVLDACSFALGSINDFKLHSSKNIIQIIDVKYFENAKPDSKFKFDLIGLKSICRDVKINSRIFAEQSTMIGIAAGDSNSGNLGDIYASTQTYFNTGLKDRLIKTSYNNTNVTIKDYHKSIYDNTVKVLTSYVNRNVLGVVAGTGTDKITRVPQSQEITNAGSLLKTILYQLNGKDVDFKALIPFELEITLDGIGGLVIGQIFTIDKSILPKDYYNKNLGFIITGISHTLQNNDWVTNVKTQICLLDNESIDNKYVADKASLKANVGVFRVEEAKNGYLYCALADYMVVQYQRIVSDGTRVFFNKEFVNKFNNSFSDIKNQKDLKTIITYIDNNVTNINNYLFAWWTAVNTIYTADNAKVPNWPTAYTDFIAPLGGLDKFSNFLYDYNVNGGTKVLADYVKNDTINLDTTGLDSLFAGTFLKKLEEIGISSLPLLYNASSIYYSAFLGSAPSGTKSQTETKQINVTSNSISSDYIQISETFSLPPKIEYEKIPNQQFDSMFKNFYFLLKSKLIFANGAGAPNIPSTTASYKHQHFEDSTGNVITF